jgi:energy-coupling factor transporter ATP-binding protein EcfA2
MMGWYNHVSLHSRRTGKYADFKVLLDNPAEIPGLSFDDYAAALAEMIVHSRAEFAVGIFGSWGSGKTTLMRAINRILAADDSVVTVWFTAWRYEKDPHLIVPLLDVLREALDERAEATSGWAHNAAVAVARAGRAFLAGLTLSAGVPGVQADFEPGKMIDAIKGRDDNPGPLSFYHAGFVMLRDAIRGLSANGTRRVVVFVDDLDRCLPSNALDVLESMKLFFDVEGCVFVVGLDQEIAEKAVAVKYGTADDTNLPTAISGADYVKKIFQVPFALPRVSTRQLHNYLTTIETNSDFGDAQRADFENNVRPHFRSLQGEDSVNPREIKRLINTYTLQLKMLSPRLGESLNPNVVLALLCMNFRPDWREFYNQLATDPQLFQSAMREALEATDWPDSVWLSGTKFALPLGFPEYLCGEAASVLTVEDLQSYVSAAESTWSTDPWVLEARTMVSRLRRSVDELSSGELPLAEAARSIPSEVERLYSLIIPKRERFGRLRAMRKQLESTVSELDGIARELVNAESEQSPTFVSEWAAKAAPLFDTLDAGLQEFHRYVSVGAY